MATNAHDYLKFPKPSAVAAGRNNLENPGNPISKVAKLYRPPNANLEEVLAATLARFAQRLVTEAGVPYTADELIAATLNYDSAITGLTGGGATKLDGIALASITAGRIQTVVTSENHVYTYVYGGGDVEISPAIINADDADDQGDDGSWRLALNYCAGTAYANITNSFVVTVTGGAPTEDRGLVFPDASGVIPVVPAYADLTSANVALDAGDFFWDTTLKKLRVATA